MFLKVTVWFQIVYSVWFFGLFVTPSSEKFVNVKWYVLWIMSSSFKLLVIYFMPWKLPSVWLRLLRLVAYGNGWYWSHCGLICHLALLNYVILVSICLQILDKCTTPLKLLWNVLPTFWSRCILRYTIQFTFSCCVLERLVFLCDLTKLVEAGFLRIQMFGADVSNNSTYFLRAIMSGVHRVVCLETGVVYAWQLRWSAQFVKKSWSCSCAGSSNSGFTHLRHTGLDWLGSDNHVQSALWGF